MIEMILTLVIVGALCAVVLVQCAYKEARDAQAEVSRLRAELNKQKGRDL
jgi:type II secretory pathway pseudopilin PulG